jgi:ubiquinone/menaquinone biosynthesis C-methylase UbiE
MILDVGCGSRPIGDVNCDRFLGKSLHTKYIIKKCKNFVLCDAEHLPFKNDSFSIVYASHVIEHVYHPFDFLIETKRVSRKIVFLQVPSLHFVANQIIHGERSEHLYTWSKDSLENLLKKFFDDVEIYETQPSKPGTKVIRGKILKKMGPIGKIVGIMLKQFYFMELTAICKE